MAEDLLRDYPELRPFVLSDVQFTGTRIGGGAYGRVDEVAIPVSAAAKTIYSLYARDRRLGTRRRGAQGGDRVRRGNAN